jgi:hypothetical protein
MESMSNFRTQARKLLSNLIPCIVPLFWPSSILCFFNDHQASMGRGFTWLAMEKALLSQAYIQGTNDPIRGADQKMEMFKNTIYENFIRLCDSSGHGDHNPIRFKGKCSGWCVCLSRLSRLLSYVIVVLVSIFLAFAGRTAQTCYDHLKKNIFPDLKKFNSALLFIQGSKPTGSCTNQEIINMAVALHIQKTNRLDYQFKDFHATEWDNYEAWKLLCKIPQFYPTRSIKSTHGEPKVPESASKVNVASEGSDDSSTEDEAVISAAIKNGQSSSIVLVGRPSRCNGRVIGKKKALMEENRLIQSGRKDEEIKKLRVAIEKRTELFSQSAKQHEQTAKQQELAAKQQEQAAKQQDLLAKQQAVVAKQQQHLGRILELRTLISVYSTSNPEVAEKARAKLLEFMTAASLLATPTTTTAAMRRRRLLLVRRRRLLLVRRRRQLFRLQRRLLLVRRRRWLFTVFRRRRHPTFPTAASRVPVHFQPVLFTVFAFYGVYY